MKARVKQITIPDNKRVICISDIHGSLDLFKKLLNKVNYTDDDILIILGDMYLKGKQICETLEYVKEISQKPNVHVLRGNGDIIEEYVSSDEIRWLTSLPHIIESDDYIFVHAGVTSANLNEQDINFCTSIYAFMDQDITLDKYAITGHWPTINYTHKIPCHNPIVDEEKHIISIDGGNVLKESGQLNAFIIENGNFSYEAIDELPVIQAKKSQEASGGTLNITWLDRYVELVEESEEFSLYRHKQTGRLITLPNEYVWKDEEGNLCECSAATDYYLPVKCGDFVSLVSDFSDRMLVKKDGVIGWMKK